ncbi:hypothetical protein FRC09_012077 [Ceratobasidium sp. 395]|nr:hypothetical protein FRC09_012077 [Ceratobasidium sp. 395]
MSCPDGQIRQGLDNNAPDERNGHGTHATGTNGTNPSNASNVSGVAYEQTLIAYRVFGCSSAAPNDTLIGALLRAYHGEKDILSLCGAEGWSDGVLAVTAAGTAGRGKVTNIAAGNDGYYGSWYASSVGTRLDVISVGGVDK